LFFCLLLKKKKYPEKEKTKTFSQITKGGEGEKKLIKKEI